MEIIYQSSRYFWKHRCNADITIVEHTAFSVLELIVYDPAMHKEAPRIYFDLPLLRTTIQRDDLERRLHALREPLLRRKQTVDEPLLIKTASRDAITELILGQLLIEEYNLQTQAIMMNCGPSVASFICDYPSGLIPHHIKHHAPVSKSDVSKTLGGLVLDIVELHKQRDKAKTYQQGTRPALNLLQRWRLAIICCKVAKGTRLSAKDAKVWADIADRSNVTSASTGAELIAAFAAACDSPRIDLSGAVTPVATSPKRQHSARARSPRPDEGLRRAASKRALTPPRRPSFNMGVAALSSSLERSLAVVADLSVDPTNKYYRAGAALDLEDTSGVDPSGLRITTHAAEDRAQDAADVSAGAAPSNRHDTANTQGEGAGAVRSRPNSPMRRELSRQNSSMRDSGRGGHSPRRNSHQPSPNLSPRHSQSALHTSHSGAGATPGSPHSPRPRPSGDSASEVDLAAELGFKQRKRKERPQTACEKANNELLMSRMMASVAAVGTSLRASFSGTSAKVQPQANPMSKGHASTPPRSPSSGTANSKLASPKQSASKTAAQEGADAADITDPLALSVKPQPENGQAANPVRKLFQMLTGR